MLDAARRAPGALVLGTRDESSPDYPTRSKNGRRASNLFVRFESGLRVADSQCGFRVYPLDLVRFLKCKAGRYGFETEILTRAAWAGTDVREVPVSCTYRADRVSHFQPWRDSSRAVGMHACLVARAILPWPHRKWGDGRQTTTTTAPREGAAALRRLVQWLNPARMWRELRDERVDPHELAAGVAVGVFIGNLPLYGVQTLLSLYAARRLHLHPLPVVAGSHVSTPPLGPVLIAAAIGTGHLLLHGSWLKLPAWQATWRGWATLFGGLMLEWSIGSVVVGAALGTTAFFATNKLLRRVAPRT
jgi:uncharacterized protein (DUF2062 family)